MFEQTFENKLCLVVYEQEHTFVGNVTRHQRAIYTKRVSLSVPNAIQMGIYVAVL